MKSTWLNILILLFLAAGLGSCLDNEDPNAQINGEIAKIDSYLEGIGIDDEVLYDNSTGMRFRFYNYGNGAPPHDGQDVKITYTRRLFDDLTQSFTETVTDDIEDISPEGLRYAVRSMMEGGTVDVYMPSRYGYGASGTTNVPANSILVYTVQLQDVIPSATEQTQFQADTAKIKDYLETAEIEGAIAHPSGIWYKIETAGSGPYPVVYDVVTIKYKLRLMDTPGTIVEENTTENSIFSLIDGLKIGLPQINKGTKATFYIPSTLGYGKNGSGASIPGNKNLIFEIELTEVPN